MTKALSAREKFQQLLRELFQFDCADLDFGIYRIMNHKRAVIEKFISEDLLDLVGAELEKGALAEQSDAAEQLPEVAREVGESLGYEAIDADGNLLTDFANTPLGKRYLAVRERSSQGAGREEVEAELFNHLFSFFSRYYQDGDFIPRRLYADRDRYAIPYDGSEVVLHWANRDQYYVKSSERFHNYAFVSAGVSVRFTLRSAHLEHGDATGAPRFFVPVPEAMARDEKSSPPVLTIPFDYRPFTDAEAGQHNGSGAQDAVLDRAVSEITTALETAPAFLAALTVEHPHSPEGASVTALRYHLRQYTRRNTSDFFIHKHLDKFLTRELDFYLKNEIVRIEDLEAAGVNGVLRWLHKVRVLGVAAERVIQFLSQLESFQKMLWEKRKFVTETGYCIAVGQIPESFHEEICEVEAQWKEWQTLLPVDGDEVNGAEAAKEAGSRRRAVLTGNPTLMLDSRHFGADFLDRVLATFDDIDGVTDGVLIHGDNAHALDLLVARYGGDIRCIHIDPPYNTNTTGFLYKNSYRHSSWLSMMETRVAASLRLLKPHGSFLCHIDENEYEHLHLMLSQMDVPDAGTVVWDKRNPMTGGKGIAIQHEYLLWRSDADTTVRVDASNYRSMVEKAKKLIDRHGGSPSRAAAEYAAWVRGADGLSGGEKAYSYLDGDGRIYQSVSLRAPEPRTDPKFFEPLTHPVTGRPCAIPPNGFSRTPETLAEMVERGEILFGPDETTQPRQKRYLKPDRGRPLGSVVADARRGKSDLDALGVPGFPYCHAVSLYELVLGAAAPGKDDWCLDCFAGSGTTAHSIINLNRADGGRRRFILVEMGDYFDTVVVPRIKKVAFTPAWKDGRPKRMATAEEAERGPRVIKYLRLESYEDALDNITFDEAAGRQALGLKDYLLEYMLKWETKRSATMLNVAQLASPFRYGLRSHRNGDRAEKRADVAETFNYLLGLEVETRRVHHDDDRRYLVYTGAVEGRRVSVIWRDTVGWGEREMARDAAFVAKEGLADGAEEVFMNSPTLVRKAKAIEPLFKERMFAPVGP